MLLGIGLVLPLFAISRANDWGWGSAPTLGLIAAGLVVLAVWVVVELRVAQPLADIPTLIKPPVLLTNIATLFVGFGMFGSFLLIPQLAELPESTGFGFGLGATGAGLLLLPGAMVMLFAGPLSGALGTRFGSKLPLAIGAAITSVGLRRPRRSTTARRPPWSVGVRHVDRHRLRVRGDGEPDRRGGPAGADRRGDRHQHARCARSARRSARRSAPRSSPAA